MQIHETQNPGRAFNTQMSYRIIKLLNSKTTFKVPDLNENVVVFLHSVLQMYSLLLFVKMNKDR